MDSTTTTTCRCCGKPLARPAQHSGGRTTTPYCWCCAEQDGTPRSRGELIERLLNEAMNEDGLDYFEAKAWATAEVANLSPGPRS
jgi:hypothetical protein